LKITIKCSQTERSVVFNSRLWILLPYLLAEVAGVTFSDFDSAPIPKFWNPCREPAIFQI